MKTRIYAAPAVKGLIVNEPMVCIHEHYVYTHSKVDKLSSENVAP